MTTKRATINDVLAAVNGVGQQVDALSGRVDKIDQRVSSLEQRKPLVQRVIQPAPKPNGNGHRPVVQPPLNQQLAPRRADNDDGEDEAIRNGVWEKVVKTKPCNKISITKTRKRDAWKLLLHMPGLRRPATFIGWDGPDQITNFFAEVMPWLSLDHFDEEAWQAQDNGTGSAPLFFQQEVNFLVEWFKTAPNAQGHTFVNVEGVYPIYQE